MTKFTINLNDELLTRVFNYVAQSKEYSDLLMNLGKEKDEKLFKLSVNSFFVNTIKKELEKVELKKPVQKEIV
jgi:hypothetical protein